DLEPEALLGDLGSEVDLVVQDDAVDLENALAREEAQPLGQAARLHLGDRERIAETDHERDSGRSLPRPGQFDSIEFRLIRAWVDAGRAKEKLERATGFEPATFSLGS